MKKTILIVSTLFLLISLAYSQQPPNAGFEEWEDVGTVTDEPVNWSSIKTSDGGDFINNAAAQVWEKSTDAHSGNYSVRLENKNAFGIVNNGMVTTGRVHVHLPIDPDSSTSMTVIGDDRWSTPFTHRPDSVVGWFKFYPQEDDACQVKIILHEGEGSIPALGTEENWIAEAMYRSENQIYDTWTRFSVPFVYIDERIPEYVLLICNIEEANAADDGSIAYFDDLKFIYNESGIDDLAYETNLLYASNGMIHFDKLPEDILRDATFRLVDIRGKEIYHAPVTTNTLSYKSLGITEGVYIGTIISENRAFRTKLYLY